MSTKSLAITTNPHTSAVVFRTAVLADASAIWRLVGETGVLDRNSAYLYLLLCRDFADTCLVAERDSQLVGFVTAYRPPAQPETLFVWQVGVCESMRRQGLGLRMLTELTNLAAKRGAVRFLEMTISPSNRASRRLFESLARRLETSLAELDGEGFSASDFPAGGHEPEPRLRIGPLKNEADKRKQDGSI